MRHGCPELLSTGNCWIVLCLGHSLHALATFWRHHSAESIPRFIDKGRDFKRHERLLGRCQGLELCLRERARRFWICQE